MNNILLIIILVLIVILVAMIIFLGFIGLKLLKEAKKEQSPLQEGVEKIDMKRPTPKKGDGSIPRHQLNQDHLKELKEKSKNHKFRPSVCIDHPDRTSYGVCALTQEKYCEECLSRIDEIVIAKKYMDYFMSYDWEQVFMIPTFEEDEEFHGRIMKFKQDLWEKKELPLIIQGHYKINIENDDIESYTVILARKEDQSFIKEELSFLQ
jgi:hypothetical protein